MALTNTADAYGSVTKTFHWLTALLILTAFPLGLIANGWAQDTSDALGVKATLFTLHKTAGVMAFFTALARILWALTQPRPVHLHPERRVETFAAEMVHWLLYASMLIVPLSGWVHHAATTGFAPIWWPFGQSLPFVPEDATVAATAGAMHWLFTKILAASILLHVAGALKHHLIDRDATLQRMLPGRVAAGAPARARHGVTPFAAALLIYVAAGAGALALVPSRDGTVPQLQAVASDWQVEQGTLGLTVRQMGSDVSGRFDDWTAAISFDAGTGLGEVTVTVAIPSLSLGSVTDQAMEPAFFNAEAHPTATFAADIRPDGDAYIAEGTLELKGATMPVTLPFTLTLEGDLARMEGEAVLDRRAFDIGVGQDDRTLGYEVVVPVTLAARRAENG
jgi:cytochrome b561/polyisoprenoid-binding protein YceI